MDGASRSQQAKQQSLRFLGIPTLIRRRQSGGTEMTIASAGNLHLQRNGAELQAAIIKAVGLIVGDAFEISLALGLPDTGEQPAE
jgi:hypothetical protein